MVYLATTAQYQVVKSGGRERYEINLLLRFTELWHLYVKLQRTNYDKYNNFV